MVQEPIIDRHEEQHQHEEVMDGEEDAGQEEN
jgi:hypothetical protein